MTDDTLPDPARGPLVVLREIQAHPALVAAGRRDAVLRSHSILTINGEDLIEWIDALSRRNAGLRIMAQGLDDEDLLSQYTLELYRRWHNYVASAASLVDHVRVVKNKESEGFQEEFATRLEDMLSGQPVVAFTKDLRNYLLHYGFPNSSVRMSFGHGVDFKFSVVCNTEELSGWKKWSALARTYLDNKSPEFLLRDSVSEYMNALEGFYDWFFEAYTEEHRAALEDLQRLSDEYDAMVPPSGPRLIEDGPPVPSRAPRRPKTKHKSKQKRKRR
jgi:hypothetical protein